jgi:chromate transporter
MTGWNHPGALSPLGAATLGALVTTWVTFLPCFVLVLLGGPYVESLRRNAALAGALSGVTASVLGVILNLALVFGAAVVLPEGVAGGVRWFPLALAAAALIVLSRLKVDALWVVIGGGTAGLARALLG